ncbi:hypothetical protein [Paracoccus sp. ME4]|uniref:hypothetical protein n=1 Tax=Paracoccus sp. ME4 TaxID=3138066 RepID=UPI00398AF5F2
MSDITASERRLSAALDRMDQLLDAGLPARADTGLIAELTQQRDEALARLAERPDAAPEAAADTVDLGGLQARLDAATEQAAALARANDALIAANRDLIEAQETGGIGPDEQMAALEAELDALRAARAAEMAQMSEIMTELERLLADEPAILEPASDPSAPSDEER